MKSKIIEKFIKYNQGNNDDMIESVTEEIIAKGIPLIEKDKEGYLITFIYLANSSKDISVIGSFPGFNLEKQKLNRVDNTNFWYKSFKINKPINFTYGFIKNSNQESFNINDIVKDPHNNNSIEVHQSKDTILKLSTIEMVKDEEIDLYFNKEITNNIPIKNQTIKSKTLNEDRTYWVLENKNKNDYDGLFYCTDGITYINDQKLIKVLNYLRKEQLIPNLLFVFINNKDRKKELTVNKKFNGFLTGELYNKTNREYSLNNSNEHNIICGKSLGGLNALYTALTSDLFNNLISHSGTFYWNYKDNKDINYLYNLLKESKKEFNNIYLDVGMLENNINPEWKMSLIDVNKKVKKLLERKTNNLHFNIFNGGHDYFCWRKNLIKALLNFYN
ncbi:MAG: alpha/beta hydrolase [Bacillota bacterium]